MLRLTYYDEDDFMLGKIKEKITIVIVFALVVQLHFYKGPCKKIVGITYDGSGYDFLT